jgi:hypothetical protein
MTGILADHNVGGHVARLVAVLEASEFAAEWADLRLTVESLASVGLGVDTPDRVVWELCQARRLVLVTANRNDHGDDSLGVAVREAGPAALPVLTIGTPGRVMTDGTYAMAAALDMLDYLNDLRTAPDRLVGTGRLYIPRKPV